MAGSVAGPDHVLGGRGCNPTTECHRTCPSSARQLRPARALSRRVSYVVANADPDVARARQLVRGRLAAHARFSALGRRVLTALPTEDPVVAERISAAYDRRSHAATGGQHEVILDDYIVIVGPRATPHRKCSPGGATESGARFCPNSADSSLTVRSFRNCPGSCGRTALGGLQTTAVSRDHWG
jgi:hypothetical protein